LTPEQEGDEFLMMGLRLKEGVDLNRYQKLTGHGLKPERLAQLQEQNFLELLDGSYLRATPDGALLLNTLVAELTA
jgi:oxygen-independent coproporphyrinogen-3 oxidase